MIIDFYRQLGRTRARSVPGPGQGAARSPQVDCPHRSPGAVQRGQGGVHLLKVFKIQVRRILQVDPGGLGAIEE